MAASRHTVENVINALIRGQAFIVPAGLFVSLHTSDPGQTGTGEVTTAAWPSYVRRDSLQGDTKANAWAEADVDGVSWNQKQLIYPVFDGGSEITITHFALWSALTAGTYLVNGALTTPRLIGPSQVFVADTNKLGVKVQ